MDAASVNPSSNFAPAQVVTTVEKKDKTQSQVKPVAADTEATSASLRDKELHRKTIQEKREEEARNFEAMSRIGNEIQDRLDMMGSTLGFSIHKKYNSIVAEISDRKSGELIKQIPSEEVLALREKLQELVGLVFDEKV
jgi:flagellar protein FlaG